MSINKYIKWDDIWYDEIDIQTSIECMDDGCSSIDVLKQFKKDKQVCLLMEECYMENNKLFFFFSETGGQNESDTQGWSRDYTFVVDSDFMIVGADYSQG